MVYKRVCVRRGYIVASQLSWPKAKCRHQKANGADLSQYDGKGFQHCSLLSNIIE